MENQAELGRCRRASDAGVEVKEAGDEGGQDAVVIRRRRRRYSIVRTNQVMYIDTMIGRLCSFC
jgi:hypothetical protein